MKSEFFWSALREVIRPLHMKELDVLQQLKYCNAGRTEYNLDPFTSMIH